MKPPRPKKITVPTWLPEGLAKEYRKIARQLIALDIFSDLDGAVLGRYLMAHESYLQASCFMADALEEGDAEKVAEWGTVQDRFFKQATASARELGLTVTSRCKLVVPAPAEDQDEDDGDLFG